MKQYGKTIKTLRKNADMTQAQLAQKLNVSSQTVSKWENGVNMPDIDDIETICALFGVQIDEFLRMAENGGRILIARPQEVKQDVEREEKVAKVSSAPAIASTQPLPATSHAQSSAPAAVRKYDSRLWIIIVGAIIGVLFMLSCFIVPIVLFTTDSGGLFHVAGKDVYQTVNPSVFCITVEVDGDTKGGSGFFIDDKGTAVTNYHVIEGIKSAKVQLHNGAEYGVDKIVGQDTVRDIAVIHVDVPKSTPVTLADSDKIKTGDKVYAIGYPQSFVLGSQDSTLTDGIISKTSYMVDGVSFIQSNVDITSGNSGGVLVNSKGQAIGMTTAGIDLDNVTYMNLSVPSNAIKNVGKDINLPIKTYAALYGKKFTITYLLDGRQFSEKTIFAAESVPELPVDTSALGDDYADRAFAGWYSDANFTRPFDFGATVDDDMTLYAKLLFTKYRMLFDGGSGAIGAISCSGTIVNDGDSFTLPENSFVRKGFKFVSWKFNNRSYNVGDAIIAFGEQKDLIVRAEWQGVEYKAVFAYGEESFEETYRYGSLHYAPSAAFTRTGYVQSGWTCDDTTYGTYGTGGIIPDLTWVENAVVTFIPAWTPIKYKISLDFVRSATFEGEDYEPGEYAEITCNYGEDPFENHKPPRIYGLEFDGWTVYSADREIYEGDLRYVNADPKVVLRAKANWVSGSYELRLRGGGYRLVNSVRLEGREEYTIPLYVQQEGEKPGYHFVCWELDSVDLDEEEVLFEDGATVSDLMMLGFSYGWSDIYVQLIARWAPNEYVITFDGNGATGEMADLNCIYDEEYYLPENAFVKEGYTFAGWQYGDVGYEDGEVVLDVTEDDGAVITFTAIWIKDDEEE